MKLNSGRYSVDTALAAKVAESNVRRECDGYSFDTDKVFTAWKSSRSESYFITMHYVEYGNSWLPFINGKVRVAEGDTLIDVFDAATIVAAMLRYGIPLPTEMVVRA